MGPCHTESLSEKSASDLMPGIRHREGGRSEARHGVGDKTAEGSKHAEGQTAGPGEPRRDPEGEGNHGQTARKQDGQAGRLAIDLKPGTGFRVATISASHGGGIDCHMHTSAVTIISPVTPTHATLNDLLLHPVILNIHFPVCCGSSPAGSHPGRSQVSVHAKR